MRKEHYKRVVVRDRREREIGRAHVAGRPNLGKITRIWSRRGIGYDETSVGGVVGARARRTGRRPTRVKSTVGDARSGIRKGDVVGCKVEVSGRAGYERMEKRRRNGRASIAPYKGVGRQGKGVMDVRGQRTFHRKEPSERVCREAYYEDLYEELRGTGEVGRYRSRHLEGVQTERIGRRRVESRRRGR